jgi:hypothetical protein
MTTENHQAGEHWEADQVPLRAGESVASRAAIVEPQGAGSR